MKNTSKEHPAALSSLMKASSGEKPTLAFVVFPGMTPLDMIGPATVLEVGGWLNIEYVWRDLLPVRTELAHISFSPSTTFEQLDKVDILCVPGTGNPYALLTKLDMLDWIHKVGNKASWVTSVCTGSILLGAAGLLKGYKAATHWSMIDDLNEFGAIPVNKRVVIDRNRVTGGGVTAGIDFGLTLLAEIKGEEYAQAVQLAMQYSPEPPFNSGMPEFAGKEITHATLQAIFSNVEKQTPDYKEILIKSAKRISDIY
ncbi:DJ-1/PfpI family protein [Photorhabdus bodei]|uniref:DJ-1/PfpI family protein n=1 Tax=Photorhabdus bodei TaxID=2029681 RepID=A0A329XFA7_9GAMM|nr:DJ-1/PfpI family protein [Photorhabdus bodei]NDK98565.1 DJ-1/PfpI family protein [Photorhabdus bodei]NDL02817.1 DJ-1/PfpI family protein [Photorhabdus bodei]NDL07022.1 DJ-1/PfpI family protein [Photorhabdus bodei]RAX13758.1 thiamine biosynthesis protein ThiJ [Photorhabdus bodei]